MVWGFFVGWKNNNRFTEIERRLEAVENREDLKSILEDMSYSELISFGNSIGFPWSEYVMDQVTSDLFEDLMIQDMPKDELQSMIINSDWEDLVGGDLGNDIPYWHGHHIPNTEQYEASREHLIDFIKFQHYYWYMTEVGEDSL